MRSRAAALEGAGSKLTWRCPGGGRASPRWVSYGWAFTYWLPAEQLVHAAVTLGQRVIYVCSRAPRLGAVMSYTITGCVCLKIPESLPLSLLHPQAPSLPGEAAAC